jgi:general secretion pathway protein I
MKRLNKFQSTAPHKGQYKAQQGFTLLEILVALSILAVSGVAVMKASAEHLSSLIVIKDMTYSSWVAENRMVEIQLEDKWPPKHNKKGKMEMAGREWHWRQEVEKVADKSMRKITVYVLAKAQDKEPIYQLSTFLGDPK